ncbi:reverse transcriptase domain-containing protein [Tanacetum coccineum]
MKVEKMHAFVDSKLVASQVEGSYEAKIEKTKRYKEKALEMIRSFNNFQISHIPREDNKNADALSKLVAVQCEVLTKGVLIEELNERSMDMVESVERKEKLVTAGDDFRAKHASGCNNENQAGMDIVEPLPKAPGKIKYLIIAVDYFTKFGIPATIITDNGTQLINDPFKSWAEGLGIKLISTSVYHPQANGAVERANRSIMQGIKTRLHQEGGA